MSTRTIQVDTLARVEGEGALRVRIADGRIEELQFHIFEPPRLFEAFLRGRDFREAPDITARICGICPVAYLLGACHAMEDVCGVEIPPAIRALRRLIYCGEWIESHALHLFMLHLPDFLGYEDAIAMARDHRELVERGLRIKKIGNALMTQLGGREVHPINLCLGGFYKTPPRNELGRQVDDLRRGLDAAEQTVRRLASLEYPDIERDYEFVALRDAGEYAITHGRIASSKGMDVPVREYDAVLTEHHVEHSTALHSRVVGRGAAHMGPLARYNLNRDRLTPRAAEAARAAGLPAVCRNPFQSILARGVEMVLAFEEALRLIEEYVPPAAPHVNVTPQAGTGYGATEAPRGICFHRYTIDEQGLICGAKIVAPTSVNQASIEEDLRDVVARNLDLPDDRLQWLCEQAIRNYDPCISCSTHFLKLTVERT